MTSDKIVTWVTRLSIVDWVHFETQTLLATLRTQNQLRRESYVSLEAEQLSPSVGCARSKHQYPTALQNLKSFRCMLDCEWMDYLLSTFQTWKLKCCVQQTTLQDRADHPKETCARKETIPSTKPRPKHQLKEANEMLINCHMWITYTPTHCLLKVSLDIFEDNEALIKMIIKGRSPTMRHVSGNHRVALDWSFDRINFEPKFQIKNVDTKNQLADMLTKESFTRDEWNNLLRLFNIMSFSMFSCSHFSNFLSDPIGKQSE